MCGIAGIVSFQSPIGPDVITTMTGVLRHRGPDDEGYLALGPQKEPLGVFPLFGSDSRIKSGPNVGEYADRSSLYLGHRRLAILDLSAAGHQPMGRNDLWIVFNGEIYNYRELRQELKAAGYHFNTQTDTEVILAAYDKWGEDCVSRFNGDWAFCVLDTRRRVLFLSRDRYGVKPLYFFMGSEHFAFASEIKALLSLSFLPRSLNRERAFDHCFLFCRDHTEETLFDGVYQLIPGQNMTVDTGSGKARKWRYYTPSYCSDLGRYNHRTAISHAAHIRDLLIDSVRFRLRADVPVGTCLSGGLDSSAIVAITAKLLGRETRLRSQNTFTAAFPGLPFDESRYAQLVIQRTGAKGHFVYPSRKRYNDAFSTILYHQDEPFGGTSIYAQWEVMQQASKHVKVVLDGQGGDEVFGGYGDYRTSFLANLIAEKRIATFVAEMACALTKAKGVKEAIAQVRSVPFFVLTDTWKRRIYRGRYRRELQLAEQFDGIENNRELECIKRKFNSNLNELLFDYLTLYSLPHLLKYEDRNSMAHSIEARVPFTDHRLVEYVFSIPAVYKIRHGWTKWLLRLAVRDLLPPEIVWRKDKLGFVAPPWASRGDVWNLWMTQAFQNATAVN
jgi:asparagine synthase (glutamine-hydrolysing)